MSSLVVIILSEDGDDGDVDCKSWFQPSVKLADVPDDYQHPGTHVMAVKMLESVMPDAV